MADRTFPRFGGRLVYLGHWLRCHIIESKLSTMLSPDGDRPCRIYDCQCGRAWVVYDLVR